MMTVGPWRSISLSTYTYRFEDVRVDTDLSGPEYTVRSLRAEITLSDTNNERLKGLRIMALLKGRKGEIVKEAKVKLGKKLDWTFDKGEIEGWYPIHYGAQPLYTLDLELVDEVS